MTLLHLLHLEKQNIFTPVVYVKLKNKDISSHSDHVKLHTVFLNRGLFHCVHHKMIVPRYNRNRLRNIILYSISIKKIPHI